VKNIYTIEAPVNKMTKNRNKEGRRRIMGRVCKALTIALVLVGGLYWARVTKAQERSTQEIKITQKERATGIDAPVLSGTILDPNAAVIAGARIVISNPTTEESLETRSSDEGHFSFADLPAGEYLLTIDSPGFTTYKMKKLSLGQNLITKIEVTLFVAEEAVPISVFGKIPD
jgi:Carboxypeptidase regulatory-like domain